MHQQEWDWPPSRTGRGGVFNAKSRLIEERFIRPRGNNRRPEGFANRAADAFFAFVSSIFRAAAGVALACVLLGAMWLMTAIVSP